MGPVPIPWGFPNGPFGPHCGTGVGATWLPDGNAQRTKACKDHDKCYGTCANGDPLHKEKCDIQFLEDEVGLVYFWGVNSTQSAQNAYDKEQEKACEEPECDGNQ